jgi:hypothetical protein
VHDMTKINDQGEDTGAERAALHRVVATLDELMRALLAKNALDRDELNAIEAAVSERLGEAPRLW